MTKRFKPLFGTRTGPLKADVLRGHMTNRGWVHQQLPNIDNLTNSERLLMMLMHDNPFTLYDTVKASFLDQYQVSSKTFADAVKSLAARHLLKDRYTVLYRGEVTSVRVNGLNIEATYKPHVTRHIWLTAPARKLVKLSTTATRTVVEAPIVNEGNETLMSGENK